MWALVVCAAIVATSVAQECDPATCKLPDCRCWNDKTPPGGLTDAEVPQIVMVTMENSINSGDLEDYTDLFNIVNPNGCAIRGTFFVEDQDTDYSIVKSLYDQGHEIGINTLKGSNPTDQNGWVTLYKTVKDKLKANGIDEKDILGARTEGFAIGGNDEFSGLGDNGLRYDSSCVRVGWSDKDTYVWPFTLDFKPPACDIGQAPDLAFAGYWEIPIADLHDLTPQATPCPAPSACRNITTKADAFDLFFKAFEDHFLGGRTPLLIVIDPVWAKTQTFREGTIEFLDYIRANFPDDVWVVPAGKALQWIQDPVPLSNITTFAPWGCN